MSSILLLHSPAKLNLYLKVINKRKDHYHNLVTLFERIDLCDDIRLTLNKTGKIRIFCTHPQVPKGPENLAYRAAMLFKRDFDIKEGFDIRITKRIPVAAGLGGGSGNAAAVLLGLSKLLKLRLARKRLLSYGKKLGSDVPFFLHEDSWALGTQRGDRIQRLLIKTKLWHVLVVPRIKVYSREVFGIFEDRPGKMNLLTKSRDDVNILIRALRKNDLPLAGSLLENDLETAIVRLHPSLLKLKDKLKTLTTRGVVFSGSGPAIFCLADTRKQAAALKAILEKEYVQVFVVRTL